MKLSSIQLNDSNPRTIQDEKFALLVNSVLAFPKMMAIRPIVLDGKKALGGNMRRRALGAIFEMPENELRERLAGNAALLEFWQGLRKSGEIPDEWARRADELTEDEKRRFIIADNASFGQWDWDVLANEWDAAELVEWGLDVPDWGNQDFSERNQEIDTDDLNEKMIIKLEYVFEEYNKVKEKLHEIADTPEQAVWKLLGLE